MDKNILNEKNIIFAGNGVKYVQFPNISKYSDLVTHCFTTRDGGVSLGECKSLNLSFKRNDFVENVLENYKRICGCIGVDYKSLVFSDQVHEDKIRVVGLEDKGKGIIKESDITGYDGLVTDKPGIPLVTFFADCVPVFFLDPVRKIIALVHSGWRGTVKEIAARNVELMIRQYKSCPEDIEAAIGPSIGSCCFEVGQEVYDEFREKLPWSARFCSKNSLQKWYIDLKSVIKQTLIKAGVSEDKVYVSDICTKCNNDLFFSHRGDKGKTGSLAAIMQLNR